MTNQNVTFPAEDEQIKEEVNRVCDKLITELLSIKLRIEAIQNKTAYHGPAIDAVRSVDMAIKRLQYQKR